MQIKQYLVVIMGALLILGLSSSMVMAQPQEEGLALGDWDLGISARIGSFKSEYNPVSLDTELEGIDTTGISYIVGLEIILPDWHPMPSFMGNISLGAAYSSRIADKLETQAVEGHLRNYFGNGKWTPYLDAFAMYSWNEEEVDEEDVFVIEQNDNVVPLFVEGGTYEKERFYFGGGAGLIFQAYGPLSVDISGRVYTNRIRFNRSMASWTNNWSAEAYLGLVYWIR